MPLMDRIYCKSFLEMSYPEQAKLIDKVRSIRIVALNEAKTSSKRVTKSAMKNIAKNKGKKRMMKNPAKEAEKALSKLTPEQIASIAKNFRD